VPVDVITATLRETAADAPVEVPTPATLTDGEPPVEALATTEGSRA
jgi:hypothetical protein